MIGNTFTLVIGVILYFSAIDVATNLNPLKSWWAFAWAGKPGESLVIFAVNSASKQKVSFAFPEAYLKGGWNSILYNLFI